MNAAHTILTCEFPMHSANSTVSMMEAMLSEEVSFRLDTADWRPAAVSKYSGQLLAGDSSQSTATNSCSSESRCLLVTLSRLPGSAVRALDWVLRYSNFVFGQPRRAVSPLISTRLMLVLSFSGENCLSKWMIQSWAHEANSINNEIYYPTLGCAGVLCKVTVSEGHPTPGSQEEPE